MPPLPHHWGHSNDREERKIYGFCSDTATFREEIKRNATTVFYAPFFQEKLNAFNPPASDSGGPSPSSSSSLPSLRQKLSLGRRPEKKLDLDAPFIRPGRASSLCKDSNGDSNSSERSFLSAAAAAAGPPSASSSLLYNVMCGWRPLKGRHCFPG
jgi:hypothetical protein